MQTNSHQVYPLGVQPAPTPVQSKKFPSGADVTRSPATLTINVDEGIVVIEMLDKTVDEAIDAAGVIAVAEGVVMVAAEGAARAFRHMHLYSCVHFPPKKPPLNVIHFLPCAVKATHL